MNAGFQAGAGTEAMNDLSSEQQKVVELYMNNVVVITYKYFNVFLFISVPLAALGTLIVYKLRQYNFAEHLVINAYIYGNTSLVYALLVPFMLVVSYNQMSLIYFVLVVPYCCFCFYQIFAPKGWKGIFKGSLAFGLQIIFVGFIMFAIGISIGLITAMNGIRLEM